VSEFGNLLVLKEWLPTMNGDFVRPKELSLDDLPGSFISDEKLADTLGMRMNVVAKLTEQAGNQVEDF